MSFRPSPALFAAIVWVAITYLVSSANSEDSLTISHLPKCSFGGSEVVAQLAVNGQRPVNAKILWSLETADHRAITRGEVQVADAAAIPISLRYPPVKEGVVLPLRFTAVLAGEKQANAPLTVEQKLWLFPDSPWHGSQNQLKQLNITVFDPAESTVSLLTAEQVPFEQTRNVAALEVGRGLVLVGQRVDYREYPELPRILCKIAAAGRNVICLAPAAGEFPLGNDNNQNAPTSLCFRRHDLINELNPYLDVSVWQTGNRGLAIRGSGREAMLEVTDEPEAWPWMEMRFASNAGRLVVCGFEVCQTWNKGPSSRFFFAQLLLSAVNSRE